MRAEVGKIEGFIPFKLRLDRLALHEASGPWLVVEGFALHWSPFSLFRGHVHIAEIHADFVGLSSLPPGGEKTPSSQGSLPSWPAGLGRLVVDHVGIDKLALGSSVPGQGALLKLEAKLMTHLPGRRRASTIRLERIDGIKGSGVVNVYLEGKPPAIVISARVEEEAGGLLSSLGYEGPFAVSLRGEGPAKDWHGQLSATIGGLGAIETALEVAAAADLRLAAKGTVDLSSNLFPEALGQALGAETQVVLSARLNRGKQTVALDQLAFENKASIRVEASGILDLKTMESRGEFVIGCEDPQTIKAMTDSRFGGQIAVQGSFSGPLRQPLGNVTLQFREVDAGKLRAPAVKGRLRVGFLGPLESPFPGFRVSGTGDAQIITMGGSGVPLQRVVNWALEAEGPFEKLIRINRFKLSEKYLSLDLSGQVDLSGPAGGVSGTVEVRDLRTLSHFIGADIPAAVQLRAYIEGNGQTRSASAKIEGKIKLLDKISSSLESLIDKEISYVGRIALKEGKQLTASEIRVGGAKWNLTGDASVDLAEETIIGSLHLLVPQLARFSPAGGRSLAGSLQINGDIQGRWKEAALNVEAIAKGMELEGFAFENILATLHADGLPPKSTGDLQLKLKYGEQSFTGITDFAMDGSRLSLSGLSAKAGENELSGVLALDLHKGLIQGDVEGNWGNLLDLSPFIKKRVGGSIGFRTQFTPAQAGQQIILALEGKNLAGPSWHANNLKLSGQVTRAAQNAKGAAELEMNGLILQDVSVGSLQVRAEGDAHRLTFNGNASGHYEQGFEIQTSGVLAAEEGGATIEVSRLRGRYAEFPVVLKQPVIMTRTPTGYALEPCILNIGEGELETSGKFSEEVSAVKATLRALPLRILRLAGFPDLTGTATGHIALHDGDEKPEGDVELCVKDLRIELPEFEAFTPATLSAQAQLREGRLDAKLNLEGMGDKPIQMDLVIPVELSLRPLTCIIPPQGKLNGHLLADIELANLPAPVFKQGVGWEGNLDVSLELQGTTDKPQITGKAHIKKGAYEHTGSGIVFKDVDLVVAARVPRLSVEHGRATDGEAGAISLNGWLDLLPERHFPFKVELALQQAKLVRLDNASAAATGQLTLSGSFSDASLAGQIEVDQAELRIPEHFAPEIAELEVVEIGPVGEEPLVQSAQDRPVKRNLLIDLNASAPGRVFVRGRGLDSEWQGALKLRGSAGEPVVTGRLAVVRGRLNFLGKRFSLVSGSLVLDGAIPISPQVDVTAEARGKDVTAYVRISGPLSAPEVALTSEPSLPSDEILSRLLFGRNVASITPIQALRLAHAARTLSGGGGTFDLMGRTRRLLGIDQLEIKQAGEGIGQATVSAGKYLREGVYLEVEKGVGPESGKSSVEVEMTPNITLETEVGENARGGVGLNWKLNY